MTFFLCRKEKKMPNQNSTAHACGFLAKMKEILVSEEEHTDWLESQLEQIGQMGMSHYLAVQVRPEE